MAKKAAKKRAKKSAAKKRPTSKRAAKKRTAKKRPKKRTAKKRSRRASGVGTRAREIVGRVSLTVQGVGAETSEAVARAISKLRP